MSREIRIRVGIGRVRTALVVDGSLQEYSVAHVFGDAPQTGDVILGRVAKVMHGLDAAFVEIGADKAGFLPLRDAAKPRNEGESVLVQVRRAASGDKGAHLTADIALPGRLAVLTPGRAGDGFIKRSAAAKADPKDLDAEVLALTAAWRQIEAKARMARPPVRLHRDLGPVERMLRERLTPDVDRVVIDDAATMAQARAWVAGALPGLESRIVQDPDVFASIEDDIAGLSLRQVPLSGGGRIAIEHTRALTAIDVDSGPVADGNRGQTALAVNTAAGREIGRQIRLRGIGGLIVVDFIQMDRAAHRAEVAAVLEKSLKISKVPVEISPMEKFGIMAIARKRSDTVLADVMDEDCPACDGAGHRRNPESVALDMLEAIVRTARSAPGRMVVASAGPGVLAWLAAHEAWVVDGLARRGAGQVRFEPGAKEGFDVPAL